MLNTKLVANQGVESGLILNFRTACCCHPQRCCGEPSVCSLWAQLGWIPGASVMVGMYLHTAACFPISTFSCCPHFGSEFTVQALVHFQVFGKKNSFPSSILETSSGAYFGALQVLGVHQGHAELFASMLFITLGGLLYESWHLWTLSCSQRVSEVERLCPREIFKQPFLSQVLILVSTVSLWTKFWLDAAAEMDIPCAVDVMGLVL